MPSVKLQRQEGETEEEYRLRMQEHEEQVYRKEQDLLRAREAVAKKWGRG